MGRVINNLGGLPADVTRDCAAGDTWHPRTVSDNGDTESQRLAEQRDRPHDCPGITSRRLSPSQLAKLFSSGQR